MTRRASSEGDAGYVRVNERDMNSNTMHPEPPKPLPSNVDSAENTSTPTTATNSPDPSDPVIVVEPEEEEVYEGEHKYIDGGGYDVVDDPQQVDAWFVNATPIDLPTIPDSENATMLQSAWIGDTPVPEDISIYLTTLSELMHLARIDSQPPTHLVITPRVLKYQSAESHAYNERFRVGYGGAEGEDGHTGPVRQLRASYGLLQTIHHENRYNSWMTFLHRQAATLPLPFVAPAPAAPSNRLTVESGKVKACEPTEGKECGICMTELGDRQIVGCEHTFCKGCLEQWAAVGSSCPTCAAHPARYTPGA